MYGGSGAGMTPQNDTSFRLEIELQISVLNLKIPFVFAPGALSSVLTGNNSGNHNVMEVGDALGDKTGATICQELEGDRANFARLRANNPARAKILLGQGIRIHVGRWSCEPPTSDSRRSSRTHSCRSAAWA
jgi:hypothetical protein